MILFFLKKIKGIGDEFMNFYSFLFSSFNLILEDDLLNLFSPIITDLENVRLCKITKAPVPDGFIGLLYKTYWHIISKNVIDFVLFFFLGMSIFLKNLTTLT
jgi:hypothetical protein